MTISPSTDSTTFGRADYSLICSATLFDPNTLPSDVPLPSFQWSFDGAASLLAGVTAMPTVMSSRNTTSETYTSTLQFSRLNQCVHMSTWASKSHKQCHGYSQWYASIYSRVDNDNNNDDMTDYFTPCACAQGNKLKWAQEICACLWPCNIME